MESPRPIQQMFERAWDLALQQNNLELYRLLQETPEIMDISRDDGNRLIHSAAERGAMDQLRLLVEGLTPMPAVCAKLGSDVTPENALHQTPKVLATMHGASMLRCLHTLAVLCLTELRFAGHKHCVKFLDAPYMHIAMSSFPGEDNYSKLTSTANRRTSVEFARARSGNPQPVTM
eukprot:2351978-Rhodomonas_salina.1